MCGRKMKATEQISGNDNSYLYARQPSNPPRYRFCNKFGPTPFRTSWSLIERDGEETRGEPEPRGSKLHITAITPPCNPNLFVLLSKEETSLQTLSKNQRTPQVSTTHNSWLMRDSLLHSRPRPFKKNINLLPSQVL